MTAFKLPDELAFIENGRASQKTTSVSLAGKLCVVSGATSGVGLAAVRRLARAGAQIVMLCRNPGRAEAVRREFLVHSNAAVEVVLAEFSDLASVRAAAEVLLRDHPRIDVLINSAGLFSTARTLSGGGFEMVFCVNHLAPFLLTHLLV